MAEGGPRPDIILTLAAVLINAITNSGGAFASPLEEAARSPYYGLGLP